MLYAPFQALSESADTFSPTSSAGAPLDHLARLTARALGVDSVSLLESVESSWTLLGSTSRSAPMSAAELPLARLRRSRKICEFDAGTERWVAYPILREDAIAGAVVLNRPASGEWRTILSDLKIAFTETIDRKRVSSKLLATEEQLWRSRTRYRELSEAAACGIAVLSTSGIIEEINHVGAEILGIEPHEAIGRNFGDFIAPESVEQVAREFANRLSGDLKKRETALKVLRPCGERRLVHACSSAILGDDGLEGVYFAARDVTEEKARDSQLRRAERLASIAPLLSGVCHELNNPLTSIKSFAELMLLDDRAPEDDEALQIIQREAARAARIVTDLRMVARQTQEESLNAAIVDLNELLRDATREVQRECAASEITIRLNLAESVAPSFGVRSQLDRVVAQLLSNAISAVSGNRHPRIIELRTGANEAGVEFTIADNGTGIAPEHVDHIFDPFWTTRPTGEGTGLGLSLVHGIVSDHHGTIRVDAGWGSGAAFTIQLPLASDVPRPGREAQVQAPARKPLRILVVDDEGPIRFTLGRYMERRGHTVLDAAEGEQALALLEKHVADPFDVILADLRMPGLTGEELYARLRGRNEGLEDRLIFITGDAESPDAARLVAEAGVPVVLKPFELAEIAQIIESHAGIGV